MPLLGFRGFFRHSMTHYSSIPPFLRSTIFLLLPSSVGYWGCSVITVMASFIWSVFQMHCRLFIKVSESIRMLFFLDIKLILMIQSQLSLFVSRDEEMKCLWFYFDREWKGVLLLFCRPVCRHRLFPSYFTKLNLAVTKNQRRTIVSCEDCRRN